VPLLTTQSAKSFGFDQLILSSLSSGYYSIASGIVDSSGSTSVVFSTIPQTFKHLQLRISARSDYNYTVDDAYLQVNGDTGSNYGTHNFYGASPQNSSININQFNNTNSFNWGQAGGIGTNAVGQWGLAVIDILDYTSTSKKKSFRSTSGMSTNTTAIGGLGGRNGNSTGVWNSTAAINQITILSASPRTFNQYSIFSLYGIA